jgi:hypothetical protein
MDRHDLIDRLPGSRLRQRLPSVWSPRDSDDEAPGSPPPDTPVETDLGEAAEAADTAETTFDAAPEDDDVDDEASDDEGGGRLRSALLGLSAFGALLSVGAAVAWRLLGRGGDEDEDQADAEPAPPEPEPAPSTPTREEGTAALLGLGFLAGVAALRDRLLGE